MLNNWNLSCLQPFSKRQIQVVNDKRSTTSNNLPAIAKGISTAEVNTHCY